MIFSSSTRYQRMQFLLLLLHKELKSRPSWHKPQGMCYQLSLHSIRTWLLRQDRRILLARVQSFITRNHQQNIRTRAWKEWQDLGHVHQRVVESQRLLSLYITDMLGGLKQIQMLSNIVYGSRVHLHIIVCTSCETRTIPVWRVSSFKHAVSWLEASAAFWLTCTT